MGDRPLTAEERRVLDRAAAVVRDYLTSESTARPRPTKVDCIEIRCHPDDELWVRALYDAPIVVDQSQAPGTIGVVPRAYAKNITMTIGFAQPPAGAGREEG